MNDTTEQYKFIAEQSQKHVKGLIDRIAQLEDADTTTTTINKLDTQVKVLQENLAEVTRRSDRLSASLSDAYAFIATSEEAHEATALLAGISEALNT